MLDHLEERMTTKGKTGYKYLGQEYICQSEQNSHVI